MDGFGRVVLGGSGGICRSISVKSFSGSSVRICVSVRILFWFGGCFGLFLGFGVFALFVGRGIGVR